MSFLKKELATFGRLRAAYRYLLLAPDQCEVRERLESLLAPWSLVVSGAKTANPNRGMIRDTLDEGLKAGLFAEKNGVISLCPDLPMGLSNPQQGDRNLPLGLSYLLFREGAKENQDLAQVMGWFLTQDPAVPLKNHQAYELRLKDQGVHDRLPHTDVNFGQFKNWACDLGFAWRLGRNRDSLLIPDPSAFIRRTLPEIMPETDTEMPFREVLEHLAKLCPLFEGGSHRREVEHWAEDFARRSNQHLSKSSAMAWLRLESAGLVKLTRHADTEAWILPDGEQDLRFTHLIRIARQAEVA